MSKLLFSWPKLYSVNNTESAVVLLPAHWMIGWYTLFWSVESTTTAINRAGQDRTFWGLFGSSYCIIIQSYQGPLPLKSGWHQNNTPFQFDWVNNVMYFAWFSFDSYVQAMKCSNPFGNLGRTALLVFHFTLELPSSASHRMKQYVSYLTDSWAASGLLMCSLLGNDLYKTLSL